MRKTELLGIEYDWLAIDSEGHVGLFCTAGGGNAPSDVVPRLEEHLAAIEAIYELEPSTVAVDGPGNTEWIQAAARGLFVYDSDYFGAPYTRQCAPIVPVLISELPDSAAIARRLELRGHFRDLVSIPQPLLDELD